MAGPSGNRHSQAAPPKLRLDKWLFAARFFRARDLAAQVITSGHLRINGQRCKKPGHGIMVGDVLTFVQANAVRVVRINALSETRGPASIAQTLYTDLSATDQPEPLETSRRTGYENPD